MTVAACALLAALYLGNLTRMGMVGPDEPRYADVGRAMAISGDWVTPRLWGQPWFEKPALLYWMTASGFKLGLNADLAPRLPVALLSLAFLAFFWYRVKSEWGNATANCAVGILATSAGWLTYSQVAVTDLPLAVFFSAAVLLSLPWIGRGETRGLTPAAACLGLAVLAKGLVPLVLFLPILVLRFRRVFDWLRTGPILAFSLIALPWYILCTMRNGTEFLRVFFIEHHFQRFTAAGLQHVQPWWFYLPILLVLLFPWFPLLTLIRLRDDDRRFRAVAAVLLFGLLFFSVAVNKLPGYLLPLLPSASILMGSALARKGIRSPILMAILTTSMALLGILPVAGRVAPEALAHGLRSANFPWVSTAEGVLVAGAIALGLFRLPEIRRDIGLTAFFISGLALLMFEATVFPRFDAVASARPIWTSTHPECSPRLSRATLYGLYYYAGRSLPECTVLDPAELRVVR